MNNIKKVSSKRVKPFFLPPDFYHATKTSKDFKSLEVYECNSTLLTNSHYITGKVLSKMT